MDNSLGDTFVTFQHHTGAEVRAGLLRISRYVAAFEIYIPALGICLSDVLSELRVVSGERTVFMGRGVVTAIVNTGPVLVCEAALDETGFRAGLIEGGVESNRGRPDFGQFMAQWQKVYRVLPEFKLAMADLSTFLWDLRLWLDQMELGIRAAPTGSRADIEKEALSAVALEMTAALDEVRDRFEDISGRIDPEGRAAHQSFCRRQLHALIMCSPFAYRTFHKPLGYAGDYEMVNMMLRDPYQGASTYAKLVNYWLLSQWPAEAHRNRIGYLDQLLERESVRKATRNARTRVLNLGCGPAHEVLQFMARSPASDYADLVLMDFNDETLTHARGQLEKARAAHHRRANLTFHKKSVQQLVKESMRPGASGRAEQRYDLIYCAGLFDYLTDRTCKQLMALFYEWLEPDGLLVATNVDDRKPFRHSLEFMLDWHLTYRSAARARTLLPEGAPAEDCRILQDTTGVNIFMEARKHPHG